jgi:hypothetical protein
MKPIQIEIDPVVVHITKEYLMVRARWRGAPHLTVHFQPQPPGHPNAGFWTPHITFAPRGKLFLGRVGGEAMQRFAEGVGRDMHRRWLDATAPVDLAELDRDGWVIYVPKKDGSVERAATHFEKGDGVYRINTERFNRFFKTLLDGFDDECVAPMDLRPEPGRTPIYVALRIVDGEPVENAIVSARHAPNDGLGEWQRTRYDWLPIEEAERIYFRHAGEEARRAVSTISLFIRLRDPFLAPVAE